MSPAPTGLARAQRPRRPRLTALLAFFDDPLERLATDEAFACLVRRIFPDPAIRAAILDPPRSGTVAAGSVAAPSRDPFDVSCARVAAFQAAFGARHFPIDGVMRGTEEELLEGGIPLATHPLDEELIAGWDTRRSPGMPLALLAIQGATLPGYAAHADDLRHWHGVGSDTLALVAPDGHPTAAIAARVAGTAFAALADGARWWRGEVDNDFLTYTEEMIVESGTHFGWTPGNIAALTTLWRDADALQQRVFALATHLAAAPDARLHALLTLLAGAAPTP